MPVVTSVGLLPVESVNKDAPANSALVPLPLAAVASDAIRHADVGVNGANRYQTYVATIPKYASHGCRHAGRDRVFQYNGMWDGSLSASSPVSVVLSAEIPAGRPRACCVEDLRNRMRSVAHTVMDREWWTRRAAVHEGKGEATHATACKWLAEHGGSRLTAEFACLAQVAGWELEAKEVDTPGFLVKVAQASQDRFRTCAYNREYSASGLDGAALDYVRADVGMVVLGDLLGGVLPVERARVDEVFGVAPIREVMPWVGMRATGVDSVNDLAFAFIKATSEAAKKSLREMRERRKKLRIERQHELDWQATRVAWAAEADASRKWSDEQGKQDHKPVGPSI